MGETLARHGTRRETSSTENRRFAVRARVLELLVDEQVLVERRVKMDAAERPWQPRDRERPVTKALRAYAALATSAHTGAVRRVR